VVFTEELAWLGCVPRTLTLDVGDSEDPYVSLNLPESIPPDFHGRIDMAAPQLFVKVSMKKSNNSSSSDDDAEEEDNTAGSEDDGKTFFTLIKFTTCLLLNLL